MNLNIGIERQNFMIEAPAMSGQNIRENLA